MKLSKKIITILMLAFIIILLTVYILCRAVLLKQFIGIETNNAALDTKRALDLINTEVNNINSITLDYSIWDHTYDFMGNLNSNYINNIFSKNNIFERTGINFVLFIDKSYNTKYANVIDRNSSSNNFLSNEAKVQIANDIREISKKTNTVGNKGIFKISNMPMIICFQPILKSSTESKPRGFLVLAKFLDPKEANYLSSTLSIKLDFVPFDNKVFMDVHNKIDDTYIKLIGSNTLTTYGIIKDLNGNAVAMTKIVSPRSIYGKILDSIRFFIATLSFIGIIFFLAMFLLLKILVIKRVEDITSKVDEVSNTHDLSIRINAKGSDEIAQLGKHFDLMFDSLQHAKEQIMLSIEEKIRDEEKILNLAYYDTLTKLPNRKKLFEVVHDLTKNTEKKFALLFIDLDNFKNINDSMGHEAGDKVLQQVVLRLQNLAKIKDYIFRMGGDEFIIIYSNIQDEKPAETLAKEINSLLKPPFYYNNNNFYIGASIGISYYPKDGTDLHTLMKNSDTAMYEAKRSGVNTYKIFTREMNEKNLSCLQLGNALRVASKNNEFILHYQPILNTSSIKVVGFEALIRWIHDNKIIYPGDFVKIAKDLGLMVQIDNWVLLNACKQCKAWHEKGFNEIYASVNVSFNQLMQPNFTKMVSKILNNINLSPNYLNLEITEDEAMVDVNLIIEILNQLKTIGVKISLDDFGTGYSSLSYVNKLPIDTLKIDKSLIQNLCKDSKFLEVLRSIIYMANHLNIGLIMEGVETDAQLYVLNNLGCNLVQGYLFSKPIDAPAFEEFIRR